MKLELTLYSSSENLVWEVTTIPEDSVEFLGKSDESQLHVGYGTKSLHWVEKDTYTFRFHNLNFTHEDDPYEYLRGSSLGLTYGQSSDDPVFKFVADPDDIKYSINFPHYREGSGYAVELGFKLKSCKNSEQWVEHMLPRLLKGVTNE